jgi:hypothetical protein
MDDVLMLPAYCATSHERPKDADRYATFTVCVVYPEKTVMLKSYVEPINAHKTACAWMQEQYRDVHNHVGAYVCYRNRDNGESRIDY